MAGVSDERQEDSPIGVAYPVRGRGEASGNLSRRRPRPPTQGESRTSAANALFLAKVSQIQHSRAAGRRHRDRSPRDSLCHFAMAVAASAPIPKQVAQRDGARFSVPVPATPRSLVDAHRPLRKLIETTRSLAGPARQLAGSVSARSLSRRLQESTRGLTEPTRKWRESFQCDARQRQA